MKSFSMNTPNSDIGLIGLAVMGQNLALNIADHGFPISVYNRTYSKTSGFLEENAGLGDKLRGFENLEDFISSLEKPRKIIISQQTLVATKRGFHDVIHRLSAHISSIYLDYKK